MICVWICNVATHRAYSFGISSKRSYLSAYEMVNRKLWIRDKSSYMQNFHMKTEGYCGQCSRRVGYWKYTVVTAWISNASVDSFPLLSGRCTFLLVRTIMKIPAINAMYNRLNMLNATFNANRVLENKHMKVFWGSGSILCQSKLWKSTARFL